MGFFGGGKSYVAPAPAPVQAPTDDTAAVKEAAARESDRLRKMRGRSSMIMTSGSGLSSDTATIFKSKLGA
jgi:hypothetical protein